MYRMLDKWFCRRPHVVVDLNDFAFGEIGLSENYVTGQIKQEKQPVIDELAEDKIIEPAIRDERYKREGLGRWRIRFEKHRGEIARDVASPAQPTIEATPLASELSSRGVAASVAAELAVTFAADAIRAKIEVFDWLMERRNQRVEQNSASYLVASIKGDYQPPKGLKSRAQRDAEKAARRQRDDPIARVKFFTPDSSWTYYVTEYDPVERLCFGLVVGLERELGYFSLDELESVKGPLGLAIERDLHWNPRPLSQCS